MRASMRADGITFCPRCDLVETVGLEGAGETEVDPYTADQMWETMAETATRGGGAIRIISPF